VPGLTEVEVSKIVSAGMSARASQIDAYQRYYDGTIYDGRPKFTDGSVPLAERAPCVVYPATRNAAISYSTLCLGDERFPLITSASSEDDSVFDDRLGLNEADSKILDAGVLKIVDQTRLAVVSQQILEAALAGGTTPVLCSVTKGRLRVTLLDAKTAEPTFADDDPDTVTQIVISYRYVTTVWDAMERANKKHVWQYRRVIDAEFDTVFIPVEIKTSDEYPTPSQPKTKYKHGFGFCPVVWYKFCAPVAASGDIDGKPIHWGLLSLIDAVNLALSQRHRAAIYSGDPQVIETGVDDDDMRMPMGRASEDRQARADMSGWQEPLSGGRSGGSSVRKKGTGTVWRYTSPEAKVFYLLLSGDALKCLDDDARDNIKKLREALGHVYIDPEELLTGSGDVSGKTLLMAFFSQIARCNRIREDFGRMCLLPVLNMLFRILLRSGNGLYLAGSDKVAGVLKRFEQKVGDDTGITWFDPSLRLKWGDYFEPSDIDESTRIANVVAALAASPSLITLKTAVAHIKAIFPDIQNVDQYVVALQEAAKQKATELHDAMTAMGAGPNADTNAPTIPPTKKRGAASRGARGAPPAAGKAKPPGPARSAAPAA
jgi:hypothetical protein